MSQMNLLENSNNIKKGRLSSLVLKKLFSFKTPNLIH